MPREERISLFLFLVKVQVKSLRSGSNENHHRYGYCAFYALTRFHHSIGMGGFVATPNKSQLK